MTYRVLTPTYQSTHEVTQTAGGPIKWVRVVWRQVGTAESMEDAKARGFVAPVLEWAGGEAALSGGL